MGREYTLVAYSLALMVMDSFASGALACLELAGLGCVYTRLLRSDQDMHGLLSLALQSSCGVVKGEHFRSEEFLQIGRVFY